MSRRPYATWLRAAGSGSSPTRGPLPHVSLRFPVSLLCICQRQKKAKKNFFFLKCQICTHPCVRSELEGIHSMKHNVSQNQSSDFRAFKVHRRSPVTIEAHTVCNPVLMSQVLITDTLLICYYFTLLMFI